jgi:hypothetical protein
MQRLLTLILAVLMTSSIAMAQVEVSLKPNQGAYLKGEDITIAVQISNFSGRTLKLGEQADWIRFGVESLDGLVVNRLGEAPESGEFKLETALRGTLHYNIQPLFDLTEAGRYRITASVRIGNDEEVVSNQTHFDIINGARLWEREVGVPSSDGKTTEDRRRFIVQQANYLRSIRLYVRVTDSSESHTYKVLPLGGTISVGRPQFVIDRKSRLHLLHQLGIDDFAYHVITTDGAIVIRQVHTYTDRRPDLRVNPEGEVAVIGGMRKITASDFPPVEPLVALPSRDESHAK